MKIGDKVRLLHGTEEGRILNIKNNNIVEIEIEDGFVIPAMKNEVVVIDSNEAQNFSREETQLDTKSEENISNIAEGMYLAIQGKDQSKYEAYIINQTDNSILFTIGQNDKKSFLGKSYGICEKSEIKAIGNFTSSILNESKKILIQILIHEQETRVKQAPFSIELKIEKAHLANKEYVQSIGEEVSLINLDEEIQHEIDPDEIRNRMMSGTGSLPISNTSNHSTKENLIDLHVDSISTQLNPNEILDYQLNEFEKAYDNALVMNMDKLKIIHGIGSGILRNEIHKRLSKKSEVKFFEDADKERFGFGSTIIYF